jgi:glycosyltransferase involved in cell wall biosynthesis
MKIRLLFIERKRSDAFSIERIYRQIAKDLPQDEFDVDVCQVPYGNSISDIIKNLLFFRHPEADVYHITGEIHYIALRLPANRTILTIQDIVFLHRRTGLRRFVLKKLFLDLPAKRAGTITTASVATKDEIVALTGIDEKKIHLIEHPVFDDFFLEPVKPFDPKCPVILQIGTTFNKNVISLIKATQGLNCKIRIMGKLDDRIIEALHTVGTPFDNVGIIDDKAVVEEYRNADIVAFCSVYEGFGLPIIEAQAMRKPVITSDLAPMNAVAGVGALLVDPFDIADIRRGIEKLINDANYREMLMTRGTANVERFNTGTIAAKYAELYRKVISKG